IDSKAWCPGFYWTWGGATRRGLERFTYADKKTMQLASNTVGTYLQQRSPVPATIAIPCGAALAHTHQPAAARSGHVDSGEAAQLSELPHSTDGGRSTRCDVPQHLSLLAARRCTAILANSVRWTWTVDSACSVSRDVGPSP